MAEEGKSPFEHLSREELTKLLIRIQKTEMNRQKILHLLRAHQLVEDTCEWLEKMFDEKGS